MQIKRFHLISVLSGAVVLACAFPALAQTGTVSTVTAPNYSDNLPTGSVLSGNFKTAEADGRPGAKFFVLGNKAFQKADYEHAVYMYKLAAFWGYHPAEYDLGIMYYKGLGVKVDHARAAAWMILAARNGNALFARAQNLIVTTLSDAEFKRTDTIWNQLKPKYGNKVTLARAEQQWRRAGNAMTGSHLGHAMGELLVGSGHAQPGRPANMATGLGVPIATTGAGVIGGMSTDGAVAYRQFGQSKNPYDPIFQSRTGTVSVEPLQRVSPKKSTKKPSEKSGDKPSNGVHPQDM